MRLIFLDTETTGLNKSRNGVVNDGHRIIEIGAVEMVDGKLTGKQFHEYVNPGVRIDEKATKIHGIDEQSLKGKPEFKDIADKLFQFLKGGTIVMHNAEFDIAFLNGEFEKLRKKPLGVFHYIDSLKIARDLFPRSNNTLEGLALRFGCGDKESLAGLHGALADALLLSQVYIHLI